MRYLLFCAILAALLLQPPAARAQSAPGPALLDAVERTGALTTYRASLRVTASGVAADPRATPPPSGETVLTDFNAVYSGADVGLTYRASDAAARGYDPALGLQLIVARGVSYAPGPLPVSGATETRWYNLGRRASAAVQPPLDPPAVLRELTEPVDTAKLARVRSEQLDSRSCVVYRGSQQDAVGVMVGQGRAISAEPGRSLQEQFARARIERGEYLVWLCNDGYIRQVRASLAGSAEGKRTLPFRLDVQLRLTEIGNRALRVPVPRDALVLRPVPVISFAVSAESPVRSGPAADAPEVGKVFARESVQLLDRSADGRWYRVHGTTATGWLPSNVLPPAAVRSRVPVVGQGVAATPTATTVATPTATTVATPAP
jgi:hypothetical protein